jgi:hypothetical protein
MGVVHLFPDVDAVRSLLANEPERATLRAFLRRKQAMLLSPQREAALEALLAVCERGFLQYEQRIGVLQRRLAA